MLVAYDLHHETVTAIIILKKHEMIRSLDGHTNFFDIITLVLQGDTSVLYLLMICLDHILRTSTDPIKENGFILKKTRSR